MVEGAAEPAFGGVEHPVIVEWSGTAEPGAGEMDLEARGLEDLDSGDSGVREKVVVEGIGPEDDRGLARVDHWASSEPLLEGLGREPGGLALGGDPTETLHDPAEPRCARQEIHDLRHM